MKGQVSQAYRIDFISFQKQSVKYRTFSSGIVTHAAHNSLSDTGNTLIDPLYIYRIPYIREVQIVHNRSHGAWRA